MQRTLMTTAPFTALGVPCLALDELPENLQADLMGRIVRRSVARLPLFRRVAEVEGLLSTLATRFTHTVFMPREIVLHRGWAQLADKCLSLSKIIEEPETIKISKKEMKALIRRHRRAPQPRRPPRRRRWARTQPSWRPRSPRPATTRATLMSRE